MSGIDLFLVAGQSNAQGQAPDNTLSPDTIPGKAYEATSTGTLVQLADPVGNADIGSAWPAFANAYTAATGRPVAISPSAEGGTWLVPEYSTGGPGKYWGGTDSTLFSTSVTRGLAAVTTLTNAGWTPTLRGILWSQGEWDANFGKDDPDLQTKYQAELVALFNRYVTELGPVRLYVFRTGGNNDYGPTAVRAAQDAACAATDGMDMVFTGAVTFAARGLMVDTYHYSQAGYNEMGELGAQAIAALSGRRRAAGVLL